MAGSDRPLSPHLQIYRWYFTMALSIAHRFSGVALAVGLLFLAWWLTALARGPEAFAPVEAFVRSGIGSLLLFGWTFALFYHLANGVRHLVWDLGFGLEKDQAFRSGVAALAAAAIATAVVWITVLAL
ncbi:MAG: succinate dehydrogenase, cytochrome b556 subunit [Geminicoccaceae bacterium]|nr:succinate dehydrogenase, cytochrome b556 subunit [Geminicoccaceae bacterium]MCS7268519.1 succinate dehydrogenase, cytochrome b556 subunit [Geminicoccaceae bacterium]MCX7629328.1 succinate dehydrogenase, cytochrome b556 subunit [Geminicoccaceae bacterium]MDW8125703.1 succinate dehydrogenase, cytochrome b556 subunit [Geminicoccaceae bacterium]MDW8341893.1 succinate dehydrogenase, cytochrome b556 subunit [Geminicoccaceae bacterium]